MYEVDGKKIIKKAGIDVNIGANPSAEGEDAADLEEGDEHVIDLVEGFRLNSIPFSDKKSLASQLKGASVSPLVALMLNINSSIGYLKEVVKRWKENGKTEDEIKSYQSGIQSYFTKKLVPSFKDLDFYTGETCDPDGMYVVTIELISKSKLLTVCSGSAF